MYWIYGLGFLSQALFAARLIIQWFLSEKEGKVVSPAIYWHLSLIATYLFMVYGIFQNDFVIVLGMALSYIISVRNLQLEGAWSEMPSVFRFAAIALPVVTFAYIIFPGTTVTGDFTSTSFLDLIFVTGAAGQLLLNFRFVYQWYYAERMKTSILPVGFWYMTALGSIMVVIYAVDRFDPVLIFAQGLGLFASIRNIQLHFKAREAE